MVIQLCRQVGRSLPSICYCAMEIIIIIIIIIIITTTTIIISLLSFYPSLYLYLFSLLFISMFFLCIFPSRSLLSFSIYLVLPLSPSCGYDLEIICEIENGRIYTLEQKRSTLENRCAFVILSTN
jgi:Uncharacterized protein conserved in bacteria